VARAAVGGGQLLVGPRGVVARRLFEQVESLPGVSDPGVVDRLVVEPVDRDPALGRPQLPRIGERPDARRGQPHGPGGRGGREQEEVDGREAVEV